MGEIVYLRIFEVDVLTLSSSWRGKNHINSFWRLYFNDTFGAAVQSEDILYPIEGERLFLLPASVRFDFSVEPVNGSYPRHFYVHFDVPGLAGFRLREAFAAPLLLPPNPLLENEARALRACRKASFAFDLRLQSLVFGALGVAWESLPEKQKRAGMFGEQQEAIVPALRHIETHLSEPLCNDFLASLCHLSRDHFIRRFKAGTKSSPQNYVLERRVALAAQKLLFSQDSIEKIAVECGFANRFYFSRMFTRMMGTSPAAFRRSGTQA